MKIKLNTQAEVDECLLAFERHVSSADPTKEDRSSPPKELGAALAALNDEGWMTDISAVGLIIIAELQRRAKNKPVKDICTKYGWGNNHGP